MKSKPAALLNMDQARDAAFDKGWDAVEAVGDVMADAEWTDAMNEAFETAYNAFMAEARKLMKGAGG